MRPAVTPWFLLALTALAALLGSGLEHGHPVGAGHRAPAASAEQDAATGPATDARVPFVGAVLSSAASAAGAPHEPATASTPVVAAGPLHLLERAAGRADAPSYAVAGGSGRSPPVTSGT